MREDFEFLSVYVASQKKYKCLISGDLLKSDYMVLHANCFIEMCICLF